MNRREFLRNTAAAGAAVVAAPLVGMTFTGDIRDTVDRFSVRSVYSRIKPLGDVQPHEVHIDERGNTWYWLYELADAGDIQAVTRRVNGGLNGLADRMAYYDRAMKALPDFTNVQAGSNTTPTSPASKTASPAPRPRWRRRG